MSASDDRHRKLLIGRNIKRLVEQHNTTQKIIARVCGVQFSYMSDVVSGKKSLVPERLRLLAEFFTTTTEELQSEKLDVSKTAINRDLLGKLGFDAADAARKKSGPGGSEPEVSPHRFEELLAAERKQSALAEIDMVGVSAGRWSVPRNVVEYVMNANASDLMVARVKSDDLHPAIVRGDYVFVDKSLKKATTWRVYLLLVGGEYLLRYAIDQGQEMFLAVRRNEEHPQRLSADDAEVVGAVVGHFHSFS